MKSKNSLKYEQQNDLILKGILMNLLPVARILQEFAIHDYKSLPQAENFKPPLTRTFRGIST